MAFKVVVWTGLFELTTMSRQLKTFATIELSRVYTLKVIYGKSLDSKQQVVFTSQLSKLAIVLMAAKNSTVVTMVTRKMLMF